MKMVVFWAVVPCSLVQSVLQTVQRNIPEDNHLYNLTGVLYGCETWSLTLRIDDALRMFDNTVVLRGIFGSKSEEITGG
jgi:hypothetical protein